MNLILEFWNNTDSKNIHLLYRKIDTLWVLIKNKNKSSNYFLGESGHE